MYINYTPHDIIVYREDDCVLDPKTRHWGLRTPDIAPMFVIPSSGVARCSSKETRCYVDDCGIPVVRQVFGEVTDLPEYNPECSDKYIVSAIIAQALSGHRDDLVIPSHTVYDNQGHIIGCAAFAVI